MKRIKKIKTMDEALLHRGIQVRNAIEAQKMNKPVVKRNLAPLSCV